MTNKDDGAATPKSAAKRTKQKPADPEQPPPMSKGAMAAERASAGIGTDDRDPDNWFLPSKRS
jgi:hypothetical protein